MRAAAVRRAVRLPQTGHPRRRCALWFASWLLRRSCRHPEHMFVPVRPEGAHLRLVVVGRIGLAHSLRNIVPLRLAGVAKAALALFESLDVVGRRKSAGAEKFEEVEQSIFPRPFGLLLWSQCPGT